MLTSLLRSFDAPARVAVFGASGGIGGALLELVENDERVGEVFAYSRTPQSVRTDRANVSPVDFLDESSIVAAATEMSRYGPADLVLVATGFLHDGDRLRPEKSMRELDPEAFIEVLHVNAVGPALIGKHFLPLMRPGRRSVFAALSARVGSISDNRLGGWTSYRASKAALNMLLRTFAIEHARRFPESVVVALHPGTVATRLSEPFTRRVPEPRLFSAEKSARNLLTVVNGLSPDDTGGFFAWDGSAIDY